MFNPCACTKPIDRNKIYNQKTLICLSETRHLCVCSITILSAFVIDVHCMACLKRTTRPASLHRQPCGTLRADHMPGDCPYSVRQRESLLQDREETRDGDERGRRREVDATRRTSAAQRRRAEGDGPAAPRRQVIVSSQSNNSCWCSVASHRVVSRRDA